MHKRTVNPVAELLVCRAEALARTHKNSESVRVFPILSTRGTVVAPGGGCEDVYPLQISGSQQISLKSLHCETIYAKYGVRSLRTSRSFAEIR